MQEANLEFVQVNPPSAHYCPSQLQVGPSPAAPVRQKTVRFNRQLKPAKLGYAWEKIRRVVRDHCRQRGEDCPLCRPYGNRIEFQLTAEYRPITLDLDGDRIVARIASKHWTIRMVRIRGGGSGYEFRRKIRSATWLLIELMHEARRSVEMTKVTDAGERNL